AESEPQSQAAEQQTQQQDEASSKDSAVESKSDEGSATPAAKASTDKIVILLRPTGNAPILTKKKWVVARSQRVGWVSEFVKKALKCQPDESLFLYVNQAFVPAPDRDFGGLYDCFGADGKLTLHYCKTQAWG
ncbi:hypothetical protein BOX15_Mlig014174g1, partial [Macrostomum lignano]